MNKLLLGISLVALISCNNDKKEAKLDYPDTKKVDTIDNYFGTEVRDPYRWLEDDRSSETEEWVTRQNQTTFDYLEKIPYRQAIEDRLTEIWNYEKRGAPFDEGDFTYFYKNDGLQDQSVLYRYEKGSSAKEAQVFLDPNNFSKDGTISLAGTSFTEDGSLLAYSISEGGSDWRKVIVMDTKTREKVGETLKNVKFSGISWKGNEGFYYSSYEKPEGSELSAKTDQHLLYYHQLGTPQTEDQLIFGGTEEEKNRYVGGYVTQDDKYLMISASVSTTGNKLYIKDLSKKNAPIRPVVDDYESDNYVLHNEGDKLFIATNRKAPNRKLVTVDAQDPQPDNWKDVIPEQENVLNVSKGGGYFFAEYMVDAISEVRQFDLKGNLVRQVELPGIGTVSGFGTKMEEEELYYSFTNYKTPSSIYKYDIESGETERFYQPKVDFDSEKYISRQVFYKSKDGTKIPMIITHKEGIELDGKNPTLLYGYGGFNISITPSFSTANIIWLEQGGVYAVPNIRGGGEYGEEWHKAGTKMNKQNVFDDFIAAAEYLIDQNYTSSDRLAIEGRSNGGLLVGATMTQRPDLMEVALPGVGVLDMLRYHKFTAGAGWAYDYGTSDDSKEMFEYLRDYSPVHNVDKGTDYPATLITTADHDDRVVPAHSFKFAAQLQAKHTGDDPVMIRIETDSGHGAGKPTSKVIEENADVFAFTFFNMGFEKLPNSLKKASN
ncbi:MAG: prolyl oligopeptidase family serine peptidase [Psychroflexus sp.]|nr:prolyl oligopeptidase family serine peptidase [Psychroflexus sp.]